MKGFSGNVQDPKILPRLLRSLTTTATPTGKAFLGKLLARISQSQANIELHFGLGHKRAAEANRCSVSIRNFEYNKQQHMVPLKNKVSLAIEHTANLFAHSKAGKDALQTMPSLSKYIQKFNGQDWIVVGDYDQSVVNRSQIKKTLGLAAADSLIRSWIQRIASPNVLDVTLSVFPVVPNAKSFHTIDEYISHIEAHEEMIVINFTGSSVIVKGHKPSVSPSAAKILRVFSSSIPGASSSPTPKKSKGFLSMLFGSKLL